MGSGIAQVAAAAGYETWLFDISEDQLSGAKLAIANNLKGAIARGKTTQQEADELVNRIRFTDYYKDIEVDLVIEAVVEKLAVKQDIFQKICTFNTPNTILATNTSSIPITQIAAGVPNPERVVGMHFFVPAHIMKLVEVISGAATLPAVAQAVAEVARRMGKTPVMAADSPGFIVNRVARPYYVEALKILEEGVAAVEEIDALMEASGFKMGPFRLMDLIGVDTNFAVTQTMWEQFYGEERFRPSRIQKQKVDAGHWGRKTNRGFYSYAE